MRRALAIRLLLVLLLAGFGLRFWLSQLPPEDAQQPPSEGPAVATGDSTAPAVPADDGATAAHGMTDDGLPLPAERPPAPREADARALPSVQDWSSAAIERLQAMAQAGDAEAALQLLRRQQRCASFDLALRRSAELEAELRLTSDPEQRERLNTQLQQQASTLQQHLPCQALPTAGAAALFDRQWQAARLGERQAMLEFAVNPALDSLPPIRYRDRFERYREQALPMLEALLRMGDLDAVRLLAEVHGNPGQLRWLGQLVDADTVLASRYARLYLEAGGRRYRGRIGLQLADWSAGLDAATLGRIEADVAQLLDNWFGPEVRRRESGFGARARPEQGGWYDGRAID